jgi:hypothetical protein
METSPAAAPGVPRLRRTLTLWDLIFYGIVLIQPIAPVPLSSKPKTKSNPRSQLLAKSSSDLIGRQNPSQNVNPKPKIKTRTQKLNS